MRLVCLVHVSSLLLVVRCYLPQVTALASSFCGTHDGLALLFAFASVRSHTSYLGTVLPWLTAVSVVTSCLGSLLWCRLDVLMLGLVAVLASGVRSRDPVVVRRLMLLHNLSFRSLSY